MAFIPVSSSVLMVYTLALANSYGRLISELKRQIKTVSQARSLGRGAGGCKGTWGREGLSHLHLSLPSTPGGAG